MDKELYKVYKESNIAAIAEKIRSHTGGDKKYTVAEMANGVDEAADASLTKLIERTIEEIKISDVVTKIGHAAFYYCSKLTSIAIPKNVSTIGSMAFAQCTSLKEIIIPDSVTTVDYSCFQSCYALERVVLGKNISRIENNAFQGCSALKNINLPDKIAHIGTTAFSGCASLTEIVLPAKLDYIGSIAFQGCGNIKIYDFSKCEIVPGLKDVNSFEGINPEARIIVPPELCDAWKEATNWTTYAAYINKPSEGLSYEIGYDSNYVVLGIGTCQDEVLIIPSEYQGLPVTSSDYNALSNNQMIVMAVLPPNFYLSYGLFEGCTNLKKVVIPDSCQLFNRVFANCTSLEEVTIPSGTTYIGSANFEGCTSLRTLDCSKLTAVPELYETLIPFNEGMQILVPVSLYNEWIADTNWAAYAEYIVAAE